MVSRRATGVALALLALIVTTATTPLSAAAAGLTVAPASIAFGNVVFGVTGATSIARAVKIINPATGQPITGLSLQIGGADPGDFAITNGCASTLAVGADFTEMLTFTPGALGTRSASLAVSDTANPNAGSAALSGIGIAGKLSIAPLALAFGSVVVGATSAANATTLKNLNAAAFFTSRA